MRVPRELLEDTLQGGGYDLVTTSSLSPQPCSVEVSEGDQKGLRQPLPLGPPRAARGHPWRRNLVAAVGGFVLLAVSVIAAVHR
jgi:hypothetical protein